MADSKSFETRLPMAAERSRWPGAESSAGGSRPSAALFADTEKWIEELESDAHWARTPAIRESVLDRARLLRNLLELASRR